MSKSPSENTGPNTESHTPANTGADTSPNTRAHTHHIEWSEGHEVRKVALARVRHGFGVLQHVRTIRVRQRGGPSTCEIDADATYCDLPEHIQHALDADAGGVHQWH